MRQGFTVVEVVISSVILSVISMVVADALVTETQQAAAVMDDLTINKESRLFFQLLSRDVRSASEIVVKPEQMVPESDAAMVALVREPVDLSRCRLTLIKNPPAGSLRKERVDYWLVGETGPPSGVPARSPAVRAAKVKTFPQDGVAKRLYPLVRTTSTVDESGVAHLDDDALVGMVRGLSFYQLVPAVPAGTARPVLPTVNATIVMSAFKSVPKGYVEAYRETFSMGFTARSIVTSIFDNVVPDQSDPDPGE